MTTSYLECNKSDRKVDATFWLVSTGIHKRRPTPFGGAFGVWLPTPYIKVTFAPLFKASFANKVPNSPVERLLIKRIASNGILVGPEVIKILLPFSIAWAVIIELTKCLNFYSLWRHNRRIT